MDLSLILSSFSKYFSIWVVLPSLILFGTYLTWKLRGMQLSKLKMGFALLFQKEEKGGQGSVSRYQAMSAVLASSFGTGNIAGMAVALATGGPGALFWMWIMAFLGSAVQFANTVLGLKYRVQNDRGEYVGGPMYYMRDGLGWKKMAVVFALVVILGAFTSGPLVQANSIALPLAQIGISPWISGIAMGIMVSLAVLGGAMRVAAVASYVVPVMAIMYIGGALAVLGIHYDQFLPAVKLITKSAFGFNAAAGGFLGFGVMQAIIYGFNRAIFATDAATGIAPLLQSSSNTKNPVIDGVATLIAPFLVMIVCSATLIVLLVTGAYQQEGLVSTNMVTYAFGEALGPMGPYLVLTALFLFAFTCLIGMASCLDRAVEYLFGSRWIKLFRWIFIFMVPVGALLRVNLAWILADISLTMMLVLNVAAVAGLSKEVVRDYFHFFKSKKTSLIE